MRQYARYGFYRVKTSRRHPESMRRSHVLPPGLAAAVLVSAVGPRRLRQLARLGLAAYGLALLGTSATAARSADPREAALLPAVFAAMHLSYGAGFFAVTSSNGQSASRIHFGEREGSRGRGAAPPCSMTAAGGSGGRDHSVPQLNDFFRRRSSGGGNSA